MNWRSLLELHPQIFDSLWMFPRRGDGKHREFHGAFIPQVAEYLMLRYSKPEDLVWDPFAGSGTTLDVASRLQRNAIGTDLNPSRPDISQADAREAGIFCASGEPRLADLIILHPPYHNIIFFSPDPADLSRCPSVSDFLGALYEVGDNVGKYLKKGGWLALVIGDIYNDSQLVPLGFLTMQIWRARLPGYKLKSLYVKDIQGNAQGNTKNLWISRHHRFGTNVFKHEYVWAFKKVK